MLVLLERLVYKDPTFDLSDNEINVEAAVAFVILGEQGKAALPRLLALMDNDDEDVALHSFIATGGMR